MIFLNKKDNIANQVISILSEDFPLTVKKLSSQLKKKCISVPERTLYKILQEMTNLKILIKENSEYLINSKWLSDVQNFTSNIARNYIGSSINEKSKREMYQFSKQKCNCGKEYAEGFCFICQELVCEECGAKTKLHYSCFEKCEHCVENFSGYCANCLKKSCPTCSKEAWAHFSENCIKKSERLVFGILEVDHECWFADLSEKIEDPIVLESFTDDQDPLLGTHSGRISIKTSDKKRAISSLLKHKQIVSVKPLYVDKQIVLRTRALINKSVDDFVRKNKCILLNPVKALNTKERNLVVAPSFRELNHLLKGLNENGNCKMIASEEVSLSKLASLDPIILSFVKEVNKNDFNSAIQKILLVKSLI